MAVLSWDIQEITETDNYNHESETQKMVRAKFDGVTKLDASLPTTTSDADCKIEIKNRMTVLWYTWDSEV